MKFSSIGQAWQYSTVHNSACKVIEEQALWGRTVCRIWLPNQDAVVRLPRSVLRPLDADLQPQFVNELPSTVKGFWGLFEIRLQAGLQNKTQSLRIPMVRRGYVPVFLNEEGRLFLPTARHIWDALQTAKAKVQATLGQDESIAAYTRLQEAAEQAGQELFDSLQQAHTDSVTREEERGRISFASRRKAIERVGLPEVRQYRMARCDEQEAQWRQELQAVQQVVPEIRPLLMMKIL